MSQPSRFRIAATLLAVGLASGCTGESQESPRSDSFCSDSQALMPGQIFAEDWDSCTAGWITRDGRSAASWLNTDATATDRRKILRLGTDAVAADSGQTLYSAWTTLTPVVESQAYCTSAWIRWSGGNQPFVGLHRFDKTKMDLGLDERTMGPDLGVGTAWRSAPVLATDPNTYRYYQVTTTMPVGTGFVQVFVGLDPGSSVDGGAGYSYVDSLSIDQGACPSTGTVINVTGNLTTPASSPMGANVTYTARAVNVATGALLAAPTCTPASGGVFPVGTSSLTCTSGTTTKIIDVTVTWPSVAGIGSALLVVPATGVGMLEKLVMDRLRALGLEVTTVTGATLTTALAQGRNLVVVMPGADAASITTKLTSVATPVLALEPTLFDDLGMTATVSGTDYGTATAQTDTVIQQPTHALANGLGGQINLYAAPASLAWGKPAAAAIQVANVVGQAAQWTLFGYETGAAMVTGKAPARRVGFFLGANALNLVKDSAWGLFDAAAKWLIAPQALLVVADSAAVNASGIAVRDRLIRLGFQVQTINDELVRATDADGKQLVVVAGGVVAASIGTNLTNLRIPMLCLEPNVFGTLGLTGTTSGTSYGTVATQTSVDILASTHALAAGLSGNGVGVVISGQTITAGFGVPATAGVKIAQAAGASGRNTIFAYEYGAAKTTGTALSRVVGGGLWGASADRLGTNGWKLFDAAVSWVTKPLALVVTGAATPSTGDNAIVTRLQTLGYGTRILTQTAVTAADLTGKSLVVVSSSATSSLPTLLANPALPLVSMGGVAFSVTGMTAATSGTDYGTVSQRTVAITNTSHALAGGYTGTVTIAAASANMSWGKPGSGATAVATVNGVAANTGIFGYLGGATLANSQVAAERRVGFFANDAIVSSLNTDGWKLFDAAILWAGGWKDTGITWTIPVTGITINPTALVMIPTGTGQLTATVAPAGASYPGVTWTTGDPGVAVVSSTGRVTAVAGGSTIVTATTVDGRFTATCPVSVVIHPTGVTITPATLTVNLGETYQMMSTVSPADATNTSVTWRSGDATIVSVDANGVVTGLKAGTTNITATTVDSTMVSAPCVVTVWIPVTGVTVAPATVAIAGKGTTQLTATVAPMGANNPAVTWSSSDPGIATVNASGLVTSVFAGGPVTITATSQDTGVSGSASVLVDVVNVTAVSLKAATSLQVGATEKLVPTISPANAIDQTVQWTTSNATVATVATDGTVTAVGVGTANITVTTHDGWLQAVCAVTVTPVAVTGVSLTETTLALALNEAHTLVATVAPSNASNKTVRWTSSDATIASVDVNTGLVTGLKAGGATITATTVDGSKTATCLVSVAQVVVAGVTVKTTSTISVGSTDALVATVTPANATNKTVMWASSAPSVATVNAITGLVTGVAAGTAVITVTTVDQNRTATCAVTVVTAVTGVALNKSTSTVGVGVQDTLVATIAPVNAGITGVTWSTSDAAVATVSNGVVTGVAIGQATITVTTLDNQKTATCLVTVVVKVTGVTLSKTLSTITVGATDSLTATVAPSNATNKTITWASSNTAVATVDQTGLVRAIAIGTANITVTTTDGGFVATCAVTVPDTSPPSAATSPSPATGATAVAVAPTLSWTAGARATSHDVYFGTSNPPTTLIGNQTATTYTPAALSPNTTYYWRVNERNAYGTTTGVVWSFTTASGVTTLFSDNFEDGNTVGWTVLNTAWSIVTDGTKVLQGTNLSGNARITAGSASWTDQTVRARVKMTAVSGTNRLVSVCGRVTDANNYYYVALRTNNTIELKKLVGGSSTTFASKAMTVTTGTWYDVKLEIKGTTLNAYVGGTLQLTATDSTFTKGAAGLATYYATANFDDILVTQ